MRIIKILVSALIFLFTIAIPVSADSLLGNLRESTGVWGFDLRNTQIYGSQGYLFGGFSGWLINDSLLIGSEGYILLNEIPASPQVSGSVPFKIGFFYGGVTCEYNINSGDIIQFIGSVSAGIGFVKYVGINNDYSEGLAAICLVVEPGVNAMVNLTDSFQAGAGISYRLVSGLNMVGLTSSDFNAVSVNLIFRFIEF